MVQGGAQAENLCRSPLFTAGDNKFFTFRPEKWDNKGGATEGVRGTMSSTFGTSVVQGGTEGAVQ